jgi:hypothetical protein
MVAPQTLIPLFRTVDGIDHLVELDQSGIEAKDYVQIESTELPYVFRTTLDTVPRAIPYLRAAGSPLQKSKQHIRIGLCWCGGPYDPRRSTMTRPTQYNHKEAFNRNAYSGAQNYWDSSRRRS